eukprot:3285412-Ditylum_brightwellii.AAC.1
MFNVIICQCSDLMISKLESEIRWKQVKSSSDAVGLLTFVRNISFSNESQSYPFKAVHNGMCGIYVMYQCDDTALEEYTESFANSTDAVRHSDSVIGEHPKLGKYMLWLDGNETAKNPKLITNDKTQIKSNQ